MATKNLYSGEINLYRFMFTFWSVSFSETHYNWTNHCGDKRPHNITSDSVIYAAICSVSLELTDSDEQISRGQKNVFRAMNWCFEAGVLKWAKNGVFF